MGLENLFSIVFVGGRCRIYIQGGLYGAPRL